MFQSLFHQDLYGFGILKVQKFVDKDQNLFTCGLICVGKLRGH